MQLRTTIGLVMAAASAIADSRTGTPMPEVTVCADRSNEALHTASGAVTRIFARISVRVKWVSEDACAYSPGAIHITISNGTRKTMRPGALAFALPYEGTRIVVMMDRVEALSESENTPNLLAFVLAHEIAHILQNVARHSATGIMKADWDRNDRYRMVSGALRFTEADIDLISIGMQARRTRTMASQLAAVRPD